MNAFARQLATTLALAALELAARALNKIARGADRSASAADLKADNIAAMKADESAAAIAAAGVDQ